MTYPYSDEHMIYDYDTHHYILTEAFAMQELGINLSSILKSDTAVKRALKQASNHVYRFIHSHNTAEEFQDYIIAKTEMGRKIIKEAMAEQLTYLMMCGDASRVLDVEKRALYIDDNAKEILMRVIPEIATSICYTGRFACRPIFGGEW